MSTTISLFRFRKSIRSSCACSHPVPHNAVIAAEVMPGGMHAAAGSKMHALAMRWV